LPAAAAHPLRVSEATAGLAPSGTRLAPPPPAMGSRTALERLKVRFGRRCRALRHRKGLSQMDIVRRFDFTLSHYQKIERGDLDARLSTMSRLARCLGVSLSGLVEGL
jgi:ribosome-binding protein aMBF1 (putative translation factor)